MKYNSNTALSEIGVTEDTLTEKQKNDLVNKGYILISLAENEWLDRGIDLNLVSNVTNELIEKEGSMGGWEAHDHVQHKLEKGQHPERGAQRLNNLINKHSCYRKIFTIPEAVYAAKFLIKNDIALSQLILRMPFPGTGEQKWHIDWIPRRKKSDPIRSVLTSLFLDDFTKENGATRIVPNTHKLLLSPEEQGLGTEDHPDQIYVEAPRGSLFIYDINLWHCGSRNLNGKKRRQLNINYRDRKIWQQINFKKELIESVRNELSYAELYLLKARDEDKSRKEFLFRHRNNPIIKKMFQILWSSQRVFES